MSMIYARDAYFMSLIYAQMHIFRGYEYWRRTE